MNEQELVSRAMSVLGSRMTDKKKAALKINSQKPRPNRKPKPLADLPCTCGGGVSLNHTATCPRGRAIYRRRKNNQPIG